MSIRSKISGFVLFGVIFSEVTWVRRCVVSRVRKKLIRFSYGVVVQLKATDITDTPFIAEGEVRVWPVPLLVPGLKFICWIEILLLLLNRSMSANAADWSLSGGRTFWTILSKSE